MALRPIQHPIQWEMGALSPEVMQLRHEAITQFYLMQKLETIELYIHSPHFFMVC
jgi:hypothetical protein